MPYDGDAVEPALVVAARDNNVDDVRALLEAKADANETSGPYKWTALHNAAGYDAVDTMTLFLDLGLGPDTRSADGETPLHIAAQQGCTAAIRTLVARGADVGARSGDGETPLHAAVQHIGSKDLDHLTALVELGSDPFATDDEGNDAVASARVYTNRAEEIVRVLCNACPRLASYVESQATDGKKAVEGNLSFEAALQNACRKGKADMIGKLLEFAQEPVSSAQKAMISAVAGGHVEAVKALLAARAALSAEGGTTPLVAAADEGASKMVRWLLSQKVPVDETSKDGATALMAAAMRGSSDVCDMLITARSDTNQRSRGDWTALLAASQAGKADVVRMLLDARAQLDVTTADGNNPRDLAAGNSHTEVVKLLDTRSRLSARQKKSGGAQGGAAPATEDSRDLDALLAGLGEPAGGAKGKAKQQAKAKKAPKAPEGGQPSKTEGYPPAAPAASEGPSVPLVKAEAEVVDRAEAEKTSKKTKGQKKKEEAAPAAPPEAVALRARLREIEALRQALDKEELGLRRRLAELE